MATLSIIWFRQDLRLADNPAYFHATANSTVLPIYIQDTVNATHFEKGSASKTWLHKALNSLDKTLNDTLSFYTGCPQTLLLKLCKQYSVTQVYWNRCYQPWQVKRDAKIITALSKEGITVNDYNASLLWEPSEISKDDGSPYRVFTPFYKRCLQNAESIRPTVQPPSSPKLIKDAHYAVALKDLNLLPPIRWDTKWEGHWDASEAGAQKALTHFIETGLAHYKKGRDLPAKPYTSRLSPHLQFGQISPHQLWERFQALQETDNTLHFCRELIWREFSYSLLTFNPDLPTKNIQEKFDKFPWKNDPELLKAWQHGQTGIPMVDAGMRELWQTGYMHNRVRMIVGSFLVKNLLIHWHHGERWFWDCLLDADLANNSASWQWVAGCGVDAAPYFRIFNPVTQGQKFDTEGSYVRRYIPELKTLPNTYLFNPWEAPSDVLNAAGVKLGTTYPKPIVDLKASRSDALAALESIK